MHKNVRTKTAVHYLHSCYPVLISPRGASTQHVVRAVLQKGGHPATLAARAEDYYYHHWRPPLREGGCLQEGVGAEHLLLHLPPPIRQSAVFQGEYGAYPAAASFHHSRWVAPHDQAATRPIRTLSCGLAPSLWGVHWCGTRHARSPIATLR